MQQRLSGLGVEAGGNLNVEQFQKLLKDAFDNAGAIVKASGARIE